MSDGGPLSEAEDTTQEERLLARLNGLIRHQQQLLGQVRRGNFYPYCHIPDLFDLDPEATRPFSVPSSFIPEQVGGSVGVRDTEAGYLASEPLDLMLGSYLPGGYKRRWNFDMWTGDFDAGTERGFADIQSGLQIRTHDPLSEILPETDNERYTPYEHRPDEVEVYLPKQFIVRNPSVSDSGGYTPYYWDEAHGIVRNHKPDDVPEEAIQSLSSDPTSQFLWFKHPLELGEDRTDYPTGDLTSGLIETASFSSDATFLKAYYATLLTLYGDEQTFSEVVRYRHEGDDTIAFVGSREESQVLMFDLDRQVLNEALDDALDSEMLLYRDLQFARLYRRLWDRLFFQKEALGHAFSVRPFFKLFLALDYTFATTDGSPATVFDADVQTIREHLESVVPGDSRRLGLLDYDAADLARYDTVFEEHQPTVANILEECRTPEIVREFAEHVLVHSFKHGIASWAAEFSAGGSDFEAWYDVNFQATTSETVSLGIYDSIQGGAGVSREVFDDIGELKPGMLLRGIAEQACCHIAATETTTIELLRDVSSEYFHDLVTSLSETRDGPVPELGAAHSRIGPDHRYISYEEIQPLLHRQLRKLGETQELARFYTVVADVYVDTRDRLGRTPRPVDLVFALEDRTFFDARVQRTYHRFANRRSQRRDISELAERVEELTKQCTHACPDCLKRRSCTHQYRYQEEMLNRRLLARAIEPLESELNNDVINTTAGGDPA